MQPSSLQDPAIVPAADIPEARQQAIKAGVLPLNSPNTTTDTTPDSPTSTTTSSASKTPSMKTATMSSPTATEEPQEDPWTVVLRKNTSATDDLVLHIPTREADFLTVAELKSQVKKELNIPTDIKLIHMGRILVNDHKLMPANQDLHNTKYVKVSDHGVIQVMAMNQH
ncbi:hypothetical protein BDF20DRAFT_858567 [Mycotypha africana]|uniref:uncharacterized protein n=1 Tax=Mycotypha africana TaxID=64632 RepID=UPI002301D662|nr:uncharacterized protein BDF20DRAFT_858567 [Mycotypha africana]KAI8984203.1 hypothetical protein BDF20DRAFT_858567 [Mycotypha africana]